MSARLVRMIGLRIVYYRKVQGYMQQQLAQKIDISYSCLGKIECGRLKNCASLPLLIKIADGLDIKLIDLLNENNKIS
ncbi:helix-turn-helix domain-containing protein [Pectinatus cerevisiiphilus]|uniref:Helix-turn-helix protein n=1 Tax=Pectinatus cerevisiiphilus TaxID=86956 RepID=A0A4R3KEM3_9FIRM|nr:helix-turn-helix transcriptional regulator [Pectinatus cerevisiiphilus]TCS81409.1 helix-turn-helix protein [Pectinatus cerevisiiphilus]